MPQLVTPKQLSTGDMAATYKYIKRSAVWEFGPPLEAMIPFIRPEDKHPQIDPSTGKYKIRAKKIDKNGRPYNEYYQPKQAYHYIVSPLATCAISQDRNAMIKIAQQVADRCGRREGHQTYVALHYEHGKYNIHCLVSAYNKRDNGMTKLDATDKRWIKINRGIHRMFGSEPPKPEDYTKKNQRTDRVSRKQKDNKYYHALMAKMIRESGPLERWESHDQNKTAIAEINQQMKETFSDAMKHSEIAKREFQLHKKQSAYNKQTNSPTVQMSSSESMGLSDYDRRMIQLFGYEFWMEYIAEKKPKRNMTLHDFTATNRKGLPEHLQDIIAETQRIRARIAFLHDERNRQRHLQTIQQINTQREFLGGSIVIRCVKKENGKIISAKQYKCSTDEDVQKLTPHLTRLNNDKHEIFVAPAVPMQYVCIDDLDKSGLRKLPKGSYILRTSAGNYSAYLRCDRELSKEQQQHIQRYFHSDPGSLTTTSSSRLCGFKNWKHAESVDTGKIDDEGMTIYRTVCPYIYSNTNAVRTFNTDELLKLCNWHEPEKQIQSERRHQTQQPHGQRKTWAECAIDNDASRTDFNFCIMLKRCGMTRQQIAEALRIESPRLTIRKAGGVNKYIQRTLDAVENGIMEPQRRTRQIGG